MILETFVDQGLAQHSYAVGCEGAGRVAIVDPRRDVDVYLDFASRRRLAIGHVLETHVHADYASGARELAARTGAELLLSAYDAGERYEVAFPHRELRDGGSVAIGNVRLVALHTPGHTPEHLAFLVYDGVRSASVPVALLSGDFLFVGSLGRPDLLGDEATDRLARTLFRSVREKLAGLPDGVEVHPGHGAGSMCGAGMSARPLSTLGFERAANRYLDPGLSEDAFVRRLLDSAPPFPPYYLRMKELNSCGPPRLDGVPGRDAIDPERFRRLAEDGEHLVVDVRDRLAFAGGHVPGAFGIGADGSLSTWAGWVLPYGRPLLLVADDATQAEEAARALVRVGHDRLAGRLDGGMKLWIERGMPVATLAQLPVRDLQAAVDAGRAPRVLDVRTEAEWRQGHIPGALHLPGGEVAARLDELPPGPLAVVCGAGYRSTVIASLLQRTGRHQVSNVPGGMGAWSRAGLPVETDSASDGAIDPPGSTTRRTAWKAPVS
jgi:hydroxyacylglutathione hydrolase